MKKQIVTVFAAVILATLFGGIPSAIPQAAKPVLPVFEVDPKFPTMPEHMLLGGVGGATADSHGNVWVFHRPHTLEEGNATENGYVPAPPVVEFSADGKYIQGWGGPSKGGQYEWFNRGGLHSAFAECHSGKAGVAVDSNDTTHLSRPAGITVYDKTNEVFVADGYGNRRVIVFDASTGAYMRHWGAYGNRPDDKASKARPTTGAGPQQFNTPHGIEVSNDGIVYVTDRANNRVQSFTLDGKFLKEGFIKRESQGTGTAFGVALSADPEQRFVYIADGSNERIAILDPTSPEEVGHIGRPARKAGASC